MKKACFTGHRPKELCGYDADKYRTFVNELCDIIRYLYSRGFTEYVSGGAQGFDQLAFWAVNRVKKEYTDIRNIVYIPFTRQSTNWAVDGTFGQKEYRHMLMFADEIHNLYPESEEDLRNPNVDNATAKLLGRNKQMVRDTDITIGLYNGDWRDDKGGTACTLQEAGSWHKPIMQLLYTTKPELRIASVYRVMGADRTKLNK